MASTPSATIHEHLNAVNQADREQLLATATYPLFQGMEDGEKRWYQTVDENLEVYAALQVRLELVSEDILATSGDVVLFSLIGQFFDKNEKPVQRVHMLWAVHRVEDDWKVGWRQFLGAV